MSLWLLAGCYNNVRPELGRSCDLQAEQSDCDSDYKCVYIDALDEGRCVPNDIDEDDLNAAYEEDLTDGSETAEIDAGGSDGNSDGSAVADAGSTDGATDGNAVTDAGGSDGNSDGSTVAMGSTDGTADGNTDAEALMAQLKRMQDTPIRMSIVGRNLVTNLCTRLFGQRNRMSL